MQLQEQARSLSPLAPAKQHAAASSLILANSGSVHHYYKNDL